MDWIELTRLGTKPKETKRVRIKVDQIVMITETDGKDEYKTNITCANQEQQVLEPMNEVIKRINEVPPNTPAGV
jgi:hypothetical protein